MSQPEMAVARQQERPQDLSEIMLEGPLKNLEQAWAIARVLAQSTMVPRALQGSPQNCLITMMLGQELGLSWTQATRAIYVLPSGQPGLRGQLLLARIRQAGHKYEFAETDDSCEFILTRKDEQYKTKYTGRFTTEMAKKAGLVKEKDGELIARSSGGQPLPWEQYRSDMLMWRAVARGASRGCPELLYGFDIAGIGDTGDAGTVTATAEVVRPATGQALENGQDVREKLAELDRQHSGDADYEVPSEAATREHMKQWVDGEETHPSEGNDQPPEGKLAPGLPELHELLRRCGVTGPQQTSVSATLAHRDLSDMSQLTPGEVFMIHDTVTRVVWGTATMKERHDALEEYLATAEGAGEEDADQEQ
jgi:hypothetical protein